MALAFRPLYFRRATLKPLHIIKHSNTDNYGFEFSTIVCVTSKRLCHTSMKSKFWLSSPPSYNISIFIIDYANYKGFSCYKPSSFHTHVIIQITLSSSRNCTQNPSRKVKHMTNKFIKLYEKVLCSHSAGKKQEHSATKR